MEAFGAALAHVIAKDGDKETLLGQAFLVDENTLCTNGHVVEKHKETPELLSVKFPASGNRYKVEKAKLHPSFVRQPDGLVRFDAALIMVKLTAPESNAKPLPVAYEKPVL